MAIILLVDPSRTMQRIVEMVFKASGHDIVAATSAADGRQAVARYAPDLVLLNYLLADERGVDLCRALKSSATTQHIPIVVMGGSYVPFKEDEARDAGADAIVMKPFETDVLLGAVAPLLEGGSARAGQAAPAHAPPPPPQRPARAQGPPQQAAAHGAPGEQEVPRGFQAAGQPQQPASQARRSPPPPPQAPPPAPQAPAQGGASQQAAQLDQAALRAIVQEELPHVVRGVLNQILREGLEARLRAYAHERVQSLYQENLRQLAHALVEQELQRYRGG